MTVHRASATVALLLVLLAPSAGAQTAAGWSTADHPTAGPSRSIGATSLGCLAGGVALDAGAGPYEILRPARNRFWGHPTLIALLTDLAQTRHDRGDPPLLVGDMGLPRGGPLPSGHRSHMSGLDADLWFQGDQPAPHDEAWLAAPTARSAVAADGLTVDRAVLDTATLALLEDAARDPRVDRLFINAAIKRALCHDRGAEPDAAAWLGKLRPWWGHDSHVHIRLACPADSPDCQPQAPVPPGTGCDASLDWWFSEEARTPAAPSTAPKPSWPPPPPPACAALAN